MTDLKSRFTYLLGFITSVSACSILPLFLIASNHVDSCFKDYYGTN